jgi:phosphohistidine phosphatase
MTNLVLWRHAEAEDAHGKPDTERELTEKGGKQARKGARWLHERLEGQWRILVSPAVRTLQTVAALERAYDVDEAIGLATTPRELLAACGWPDGGNVIAVGHQPTLGEVAEMLVRHEVRVKKGAILWIVERDGTTSLMEVFEP